MRLIAINPDNIDLAWKTVLPWVEDGLKYCDGKYLAIDVRELILSKTLTLWVVYNDDNGKAVGACVTEIIEHPRCRILSIFILAGNNFSELVQCLDDLKEYAKGAHCSAIEFYGRAGWEKVLQPFQFTRIHTVMRLKL